MNYELATGSAEGSDLKLVSGNLELYGRTVWATRTGLAFGGGIGLLAPTAAFDPGSPAESVAGAAASLRPWDVAFFSPHNFAVNPFIDARDVSDRFVIQWRQGLDITVDVLGHEGGRSILSTGRVAAIGGLYMGYRIGNYVSPGIEAFELYTITGGLNDDRQRANIILSPSVRVMTPYLQPALSFFTNVGPTLATFADRVFGVRLGVTVVYDTTTKTIKQGTRESQ
jgi:hypothetical protein